MSPGLPHPHGLARTHFWLEVPAQSANCNLVPLPVPLLTAATHLLARMLTRSPPVVVLRVHTWAGPPLQLASWTVVPAAVFALATSMHSPSEWMVPR